MVLDMLFLLGYSYTADEFHSVMDYCGEIVSLVALREMRTKSLLVLLLVLVLILVYMYPKLHRSLLLDIIPIRLRHHQ